MEKIYTQYNSSNVNAKRLDKEIRVSSLGSVFLGLTVGMKLTIHFSSETIDEAVLNAILTAHNPSYVETEKPIPKVEVSSMTTVPKVEIQTQPDPAPFAVPSYRTKWNASSEIQEMTENSVENVDLVLTEERYCHGGEIIFEGAQIGDWIEASIYDDSGVIPEAYRPAICEAWPLVATYIKRYNLRPGNGARELNTYPLNAKITPGLTLRVTLHTCATPGTRKFGTNYFLTKKL